MNAMESSTSEHDAAAYNPALRLVLGEDLVTDQALTDAGEDEFHHAAIAKAVGDLALSSTAPVNVALFGPWGSGKSTFYHLMANRIKQQDPAVCVVRYDAWKYGGQALKRNFLQEVAQQLDLKRRDFDRDLTLNQEQSRIRLGYWARYNWKSILGATVVGLGIAAVWTAAHSWVDQKWLHPEQGFWHTVADNQNEFGLVLAAVLTALLLGPKALESAVVKTTRPAIERDDQFARMFRKLIARIKKERKVERIVFFIDELDRCQPTDVVATLVDLKTFLDEPDCVFIVAADRDVIEQALSGVPQAKPIRPDDPYYSTPGAFLDKIFQHQIALPPLRSHALSSFAHRLVSSRAKGLWRQLQDGDRTGRLFNDVVYILIPAHVSSPRRVKVLLNNFATNARIAQSWNIDWIERARELAFLTVLETEFPSVARTLVRFPDLLTYLRNEQDKKDLSPDRKAQIDLLDPQGDNAALAGKTIRAGDDSDDELERLAQRQLARQLNDYLSKLAVVADLHDPRPDLFYLRVIGYDEGLTNPALGEMIDLAAERRPGVVVNAFEGQPPHIKSLAAQLLIRDLAHQRGIGQANVLESACRIVEQLPRELVLELSHLAPEILTHVNDPSWRSASIPGAVFLAAGINARSTIVTLMNRLTPGEDGDPELLIACLPALAWTTDKAARPVHAKIAAFIATNPQPLATGLAKLPIDAARRLYDDTKSAIGTQYEDLSPEESRDLFDVVTNAVLRNEAPRALLWQSLFLALNKSLPTITARIHTRRDELLPVLSKQNRARVALYSIEIGDQANWDDWLPYILDESLQRRDLSDYARDAANVLAADLPTNAGDLSSVFTPIARLLNAEHKAQVLTSIAAQVPAIAWADANDLEGQRWINLDAMVERVSPDGAEDDQVAQAVAASLLKSVTASIQPTTAVPPAALVAEWRTRIAKLSATAAQSLDDGLAQLTAPTAASGVVLLRLRIASRLRSKQKPLPVSDLLTVLGEPTASVMAGEWLGQRPRVQDVVQVHQQIPIGTGPLGTFAAHLKPALRTKLWIALEGLNASKHHLKAVGQAGTGVQAAAIEHMRPAIVTSSKQSDRDYATNRLLLATFAEEPTKAEKDKGQFESHKAASALALALIDTGINDNVVLGARIVIHSGGYAHGTKTKLRHAFTRFGHGKQSRNFTKRQAVKLRELDLIAPTKKGRWGWLSDWLAPQPPS